MIAAALVRHTKADSKTTAPITANTFRFALTQVIAGRSSLARLDRVALDRVNQSHGDDLVEVAIVEHLRFQVQRNDAVALARLHGLVRTLLALDRQLVIEGRSADLWANQFDLQLEQLLSPQRREFFRLAVEPHVVLHSEAPFT